MKNRMLFIALGIGILYPHLAYSQLKCTEVLKIGASATSRPISTNRAIEVDALNQQNRAVEALENRAFEEALQWAMILVRLHPRNVENLVLAARALEGLGKFEEASLFFEKAAELSQFPYPHLLALVRVYGRSKNYEKQIDAINRMLEIDGDNPIGLNLLMGAQINLGRIEAARQTFERFSRVEKDPKFFISAKLKLLFAEGKYSETLKSIEKFAEDYPHLMDAPLYGMKAKTQVALGQIKRATRTYLELLNLEPNNIIALSQGGHLLILQGKFAEALPLLRRANEVEPGNPMIFWNRVIALLALGRVDVLERTLVNMKDSYFKKMVNASIALSRGDFQKAIEYLDSIPAESQAPKALVLLLKAQAQYESGRVDLAYKSLMEIVRTSIRVNYTTIAAIVRIERMDTPLHEFEASPALQAIMASLNPREVELVVKTSQGNIWSYESKVPAIEADPAFANSFWGRTNNIPVNGPAVKELKTHE